MDTHTITKSEHDSKMRVRTLTVTVFLTALVTVCACAFVGALLIKKGVLQQFLFSSPAPSSLVEKSDEVVPDIVEKAAPAVVSIVITADVPIIERYFEKYDPFDQFFGSEIVIPKERQLGTEKREIGGGTGFFVSPEGYIVTNRHVVELKDASYSIVTNEGESYDVVVVAKDAALDVAILKVKSEKTFPYLVFGDSNTARLGSSVIAIGNALAELRNSVSVGVISGLSRNIVAGDGLGSIESLEGVIQTDAAINQGNSGGPLLNLNGDVIGVNVAVAGNSENIGFALPSVLVKNIFESVKEYGAIVRPFIGVRYQQIDEALAKKNKLVHDYGVLIVHGATASEVAVLKDSPGDKAGLKENDIILEFGGVKLDGKQSLGNLIRQKKVGDVVSLKIVHEGEEKEVAVTLGNAPTE